MNGARKSVEAIVEDLRAEGFVPEALADHVAAVLERLRGTQPWYIRLMVGFGAWLASVLLVGFVAGFGMAIGGITVLGGALIVAALFLRRRSGNDFVVQSSLAVSLAGQSMLAWGVYELSPGSDPELMLVGIIAVSGVLFFVFPDFIHRVLSVTFAAGALAMLLYFLEWNALIPVTGPAFAAALVLVHRQRARITAAGKGHLVRPLENGLMLSAFGLLLLSAVHVLPEIDLGEFRFYPRPWISTLLLGALFLYVGTLTWPSVLQGAARPVAYGLMALVAAAAWAAPGLLLALIVIMLGAAGGHRSFIGAGIAFLALFTGAYFYGIEISMLAKSVTLIAAGAVVLLARWLLLGPLGGAGEPRGA